MLTLKELSVLAAQHAQSRVLSAYITVHPGGGVPMERARVLLRNGIAATARSLRGASHGEREEFDECAAKLLERIADWHGTSPPFTWIGFAPAGDAATVSVIPDSLPPNAGHTVSWRDGLVLAPWFALRPTEPCLVSLVDHERATFLRFGVNDVREVARFETKAKIDTGSHMSAPPQRSFHHGTHGAPASDNAARQSLRAYHRHRSLIVETLKELDTNGMVLLGGDAETMMHIVGELPQDIRRRVTISHDLHFNSTIPEMRTEVIAFERRHLSLAERSVAIDVTGRARTATSTGALGFEEVRSALDQGAVGTLLISIVRIDEEPETIETIVRSAIAQHATVRVLHGGAAAFIESSAGGIAAALRFPVSSIAAGATAV